MAHIIVCLSTPLNAAHATIYLETPVSRPHVEVLIKLNNDSFTHQNGVRDCEISRNM